MPVRRQTERGNETPYIRHFAVFLPNRVGQLNELLAGLDEVGVEIAGISMVDSSDWVVVRMVFADVGKAREMLTRRGVAFTESDALAVVLAEGQTIAQMCKPLVVAELNLFYAFALLIRFENQPVLVLRVDDHLVAAQVLAKHGFTLLDYEDL